MTSSVIDTSCIVSMAGYMAKEPTAKLRIKAGVLQQMWRVSGNDEQGNMFYGTEWQDVEVVE